MLTTKEAQLGSLMARIAALGTIVSFAIIALLVGPNQVGYNEQYGGILNIIGFVQSFALLFTISSFSHVVCLRGLFLGDNDLTTFPPSIEQFVHLEIVSTRIPLHVSVHYSYALRIA